MPFKVKAANDDISYDVPVAVAGPTLLEILQASSVPIKSSCMGKGVCRQCRVQVTKGIAPVQPSDRKSFSEDHLAAGWRLSCALRPRSNLEVRFPQAFVFQKQIQKLRAPVGPWWCACDLGTTGFELAAVDEQGVWASVKALNQQVLMGADVMTRLEFAQRRGVIPLYDKFQKQLLELRNMLLQASEGVADSGDVWVAGNSAMAAFVLQQPIETLAVSPYQPVDVDPHACEVAGVQVHTLPLLHSFVGGDLWAGLFELHRRGLLLGGAWVLMDVGTNSEILAWDGEKLIVSSTPAGPAFEGSSISIGMRAEAGAITHPVPRASASDAGGFWDFQVVGNDVPKGICGSALVGFINKAVDHGWISPDGEVLSAQHMQLTARLAVSQDDVREFQLAKSAIQTGLQLVTESMSLQPTVLYLAGAFGEHLPLDDSRSLGLLPSWRVETLGNSSLSGTILWGAASERERSEFTKWVRTHQHPLELALSDEFQSAFVQNMSLRC